MADAIRSEHLQIGGMTCANCQSRIEEALRATGGVIDARVSWSRGCADVTYDAGVVSTGNVKAVIERLDYEVLPDKATVGGDRAVGLIIIIAALFFLISKLNLVNSLPLAEEGMGYGMLFLIGLLTSVHCVAMCGGINLSQCIPQTGGSSVRPSLLYNFGRVVSYTVVGGIVGALGSVITFSGAFRGIIQLLAGVFMVIMGVNMLGIFPWLRKFQPRLPRALSSLINREKGRSNSPLIVGLLNGLMPCGPLQAMQLYALSTGSPFRGAVSMLLFSLGTVPLMFGLGALSSLLSKKFTRKVMTAGAVLVTVLGLTMFSQGFALSGFAGLSFTEGAATESVIVDGVQFVSSTLASGAYPKITVQAGIPVKWTIDAPKGSINGCNNRLQIPEYGLEYKFQTGENIIEFTPTETGKIPYSCWMGMIRSSITVVEAGAETPPATVPANVSIPTDNVAVAELITAPDGSNATSQEVTIALTDDGYSPAIVVVQADVETAWVIDVDSTADSNFSFLVPIYGVYEELNLGENGFYLFPSESFEFSNGDNSFYGYVAVVEDLETADTDAIRREVSAFQTLIYPPDTFLNNGAVPSCHRPQDGEEY